MKQRRTWQTIPFKKKITMFEKNNNYEPFFIAEVGQNHNGSIDVALEYIKLFADAGADAIKFQTRSNKVLFAPDAYNRPYHSENAFADTYGAHREALELKPSYYKKIKARCRELGVYFMSTPFDEPSLELLNSFDVDLLKVASFDLGNLPFLDRIARCDKPVVISTGGGDLVHIRQSINFLSDRQVDLAVLHCVSEYPCPHDRLNLRAISTLRKEFPDCTIGLSDHFNGILSGPVSYMLGARVFEKHVTLNRASKGTDHSFALEPEGFKKFVRDTKRVSSMLGNGNLGSKGKEAVFKKLGKSVASYTDIQKGEVLSLDNLAGRIFENEIIPIRDVNLLIGKKAKRSINRGEAITMLDFE